MLESYLFSSFSPVVNIHFLTENLRDKQHKYQNEFDYLHGCKSCVISTKCLRIKLLNGRILFNLSNSR